ncbi:MAG TPA: digeranylgeranylglyceryl phosphate synthase [Nanoarchaeota archaeon]|nr:digeranylgeranylglyceryl phosphate synthase [Nanoarchaeota archaeon]
MKDFILLLRPVNCLMAGLAIIFSLWIGDVSEFNIFLLAFVSVFFICAGGMLINDFFDIEIDKINKPQKWKITKKYSKLLVIFSSIFFCIGIITSLFLGINAFLLAFFNSILLILYSFKLKRIIFIKNLVIAYLVASIFLYGGIISQNPAPIVLSLLAFVSNIGREIIKDVEDFEGDKKANIKTLAVAIGKFEASIFSISFMLCSIALAPLPYLLGIFSDAYLLLVLPCVLSFAYTCVLSLISPSKAVKWSKISMFLGLLAFIGGKLF